VDDYTEGPLSAFEPRLVERLLRYQGVAARLLARAQTTDRTSIWMLEKEAIFFTKLGCRCGSRV
jgi:hypothetical protein